MAYNTEGRGGQLYKESDLWGGDGDGVKNELRQLLRIIQQFKMRTEKYRLLQLRCYHICLIEDKIFKGNLILYLDDRTLKRVYL